MSVNDSLYLQTSAELIPDANESSFDNLDRQNTNYYVIDEAFLNVLYKVTACGVIPPIIAFGIVGNVLTLMILARQKPIRSTTILLISIAIADLAFLGVVIINETQLIIRMFFQEISQEVRLKLIIPFAVYISPLPARISNFLVMAITLERLIAVTYPLKVKEICTKTFATVLSIILSISAALIQLPKIWMYEVKNVILPDGNITSIVSFGVLGKQTQMFETYYIISETVMRFLPMGVMVTANSIIIAVIIVQAKWRKKSSDVSKPSYKADELQITKTLLTITCIFIVCVMPSTISRLMSLFDPESTLHSYSSNVYSLLTLIGLLTETLNSSVNFIVYVNMSNTYRAEFYKICSRAIKMKQTSDLYRQGKGSNFRSYSTTDSPMVRVDGEETHM